MNRLIEDVSQYVKKLYETHPTFYRYHNLHHTREVVKLVKELAENSDVGDADLEILLIAAWFHDIGYPDSIQLHEEKSAEMAAEFLEKKSYPPENITTVKKLILSTKVPQKPENLT